MSEVDERDLELLKLAARAAQLEIEPCTCRDPKWPFRLKGQSGVRAHWSPLINDGDALRLAVLMGRGHRLGIQIHIVEPAIPTLTPSWMPSASARSISTMVTILSVRPAGRS